VIVLLWLRKHWRTVAEALGLLVATVVLLWSRKRTAAPVVVPSRRDEGKAEGRAEAHADAAQEAAREAEALEKDIPVVFEPEPIREDPTDEAADLTARLRGL
jgi:hypothetical protein